MKKWIFIILMLNTSFNRQQNYVYYKCLPFNTKTAYPITEEILLEMKQDSKGYIKSDKLYGLKLKKNIENILVKIIIRKRVRLLDYDLRFLIETGNKKYFINWDKKYLLTDGNFYSISLSELESLKKELKCKCN
jgi:hypothetical protein